MKKIIAKKWYEISKLGDATFTGVPVMVPDDFPAKSGAVVNVDQKKMLDTGISGDVIQRMDLEIAKKWVIEFIKRKRAPSSITADEVHGILLVLGISKTDFAKLLKVDKATVTKYVAGSLTPSPPVTQLMLIYLAAELTKRGTAQGLVDGGRSLITGLTLTVPTPKFVISNAA